MDQVRIDFADVLASSVGAERGLAEPELQSAAQAARAALEDVQARRDRDQGFLDLPRRVEEHAQIQDYAASVQGRFRAVVVLGSNTGLQGVRALQTALNSPYQDLALRAGLPQLFVLDDVDPDVVGEFLDVFDASECLFDVVSKAGDTPAALAPFLIVREKLVERLGAEGHKDHVVITTGMSGALREIARRESYVAFDVPEACGERKSSLSSVGLVPAALAGVDVMGIVAGAAAMNEVCASLDAATNPAVVFAAVHRALSAKRDDPIAVTSAFGHRLRDLADWSAQLFAAAHGPRRALVAAVRHDEIARRLEGLENVWFTTLAVERADHKVEIPSAWNDLEATGFLAQKTLNELFAAERDGLRDAFVEAQRPNLTVTFPSVTAHTIGQFVQLAQIAVAVLEQLGGVRADGDMRLDAASSAAFARLGRPGHEDRRRAIDLRAPRTPRIV